MGVSFTRRAALVAILLIIVGGGLGYLLGRSTDNTDTVTVTVGERLEGRTPPYGKCDKLGINDVEGKQGTCIRAGITYTVVNRHTPLSLEQLEVKLVDINSAESVGGAEAPRGKAFVVVVLGVRNKLNTSARFDDAEQAVLADTRSEYAESRTTSRRLDDSFASRGVEIRPGESLEGSVVFLTTAGFAESITSPGKNVVITNFNDAGRIEQAKRLGVIRMWK